MFTKIIVGVDGGSGGHDAVALARQLAGPDARITPVHVTPGELTRGRASDLAYEAARRAASAPRSRSQRPTAPLVRVASTSVGHGLQRFANECAADLLVVGSSSRGLIGRILVGDHARATLNGAPCAVAIAPYGYADMPHDLASVGVGYDASPESHQALAAARALAARHGSTIRALSVVSLQSIPYGEPIPVGWPEIADGLVDDELKRFHDVADVDGDATYGEPSEELARFGDEVDLLIVGSRGYGPLGRLFNGSTSNYLARRARCPLLVLPRTAAAGDEPADTGGGTGAQPGEHWTTEALA